MNSTDNFSSNKGRDSGRLSSDGSTQTVYQNGLQYETDGNFGEPNANAVNIEGKTLILYFCHSSLILKKKN